MRTAIAATALLLAPLAPLAPHAQAVAQGSTSCRPTDATRRAQQRLQALADSLVRDARDVPAVALTVFAPKLCLEWSGAAGVANRTTRAPMTPQHPVRIASNTKTYTAAAILRLMELGKLSLDDPVTKHLPASSLAPLARDGYDLARITIRLLLQHRAGIYDYAMDSNFMAVVVGKPTHRWTRAEQVDSATVWGAPYGPPGGAYHYTDTGYILLGEIVERLTGLGLGEAFRSLLHYDALGLRSTWLETLEPRPAGALDLAHQYMDTLDTRGIDPSFDLYGGGGLAATTADMGRFTRALFVGGVFDKPATITTMSTLPEGAAGPRAYALGVYRQELGGEVWWGHSGFWNTASFYLPARGLTFAASISQQGKSSAMRALLAGALAIVTDAERGTRE
ncbi:MAG TPA: serine hydrolase domain-containing protein [Gemmatimonadaceae bacterium]|nr:serine hydrolase domain-containing protein [Gemmatimonadaceae bacterium]